MIFKNAFVASAANFHLILVVPMGVREMNWEISVILLFNLTLPAISHPFIPIENSLSGAVLPCLSFVKSQGLSRGLKNRVRVPGSLEQERVCTEGDSTRPFPLSL